ncbi:MAG: DUF3179 domain-containing protein [Planctomycetia bacterium]|nr:DUF3179 domain-containing protein [Planctomycetia bacterium]
MSHRYSLLFFACTIAAAHCLGAEPTDLKLIVRPDAHATLVNPQCSHCADEARRRAKDLRDDDRVLAWTRGKYEGGGIPYRFFLVPYRVISDTYGVFVFDPDAGFARGFEPSLDFTFYGWRNGVMVMKHKDGTLYSTLSGRAFAGPRAGDQLKPIATIATNWGYWNTTYPGSVAYQMLDKYQGVPLPAEASQDSLGSRRAADPRADAMTEVIGVEIGGKTRAYPLSAIKKAGGILRDQVAGQEIVVLWYDSSHTSAVYAPEVEDGPAGQRVALEFDASLASAPFVDRNTKSRFGIEGRAQQGPLKGMTLRPINSVQCRWFAWSAEYPQTELLSRSEKKGTGVISGGGASRDALLVAPWEITLDRARQWRQEGFGTLVALLDEEFAPEVYQQATRAAAEAQIDLYYWIEVARNSRLADAHPEWMASLGMHDDWRRGFPNLRQTDQQEVVKAYPWVPIGYRAAFDAQFERVKALVARVPPQYRGVLLNDLQGGPSSCGCGNLQCRWALDYHVQKTAETDPGDDVAARWLARVKSLIPDREVIPVWTTECEEIDLSAEKRSGVVGTGLCGDVSCATGTCPKAFSKQWQALCESHAGPIGVLLDEKELDRQGPFYGSAGAWITRGLDYLDRVPAQHGGKAVEHERLWLVVQGEHGASAAETARRTIAGKSGPGMVLVARTRLDQSYEPRIVRP